MIQQIKKYSKTILVSFLVFILGFFLIKRGIDLKVAQDLAIEKAKEDAIKLEILKKEQEEKEALHKKYEEEQRILAEEAKKKQEELDRQAREHKKTLKKEAKNQPDEFGKKFSNKFKVDYNKEK